MFEDVIDETVRLSFISRHEIVAVGVFFDLVQCLTGMLQHQFIHPALGSQDFLGVDFQFHGSPLHPGERLVDHDSAVGQCESLSLGPGRQQHRTHAGTLAQAVGRNVACHELHRVVDRHPLGDRATRAVDVHMNVGLAIFELQVQQLGNDAVRNVVINRAAEKDDAISKQPAVNIHGAFFAPALFNNEWNE